MDISQEKLLSIGIVLLLSVSGMAALTYYNSDDNDIDNNDENEKTMMMIVIMIMIVIVIITIITIMICPTCKNLVRGLMGVTPSFSLIGSMSSISYT